MASESHVKRYKRTSVSYRVLEPRILQHLINGRSLLRVQNQHPPQQLYELVRIRVVRTSCSQACTPAFPLLSSGL